MLANPKVQGSQGLGQAAETGQQVRTLLQGCVIMGRHPRGDPGRATRCHVPPCSSAQGQCSSSPSNTFAWAKVLLSARGKTPKFLIQLMPFHEPVGACMSHSWNLWHEATRTSVLQDRSWVRERRKMGTNRHCGAEQGDLSEPPWKPVRVWAPWGRFQVGFPQ